MHPELAVVAFRDVQRAWEVLRDPQLRAVHDRELALAELRSVLSFQDELEVDEMELHGV
ncbi:hypothetical protein FOA52_007805 [Chlamydomonas sp. UWO 241]|nr:hypothetical protein FOA52_007805 [Chlamydomonas sp. UWO 241]